MTADELNGMPLNTREDFWQATTAPGRAPIVEIFRLTNRAVVR
jgi:hypothetical protein